MFISVEGGRERGRGMERNREQEIEIFSLRDTTVNHFL